MKFPCMLIPSGIIPPVRFLEMKLHKHIVIFGMFFENALHLVVLFLLFGHVPQSHFCSFRVKNITTAWMDKVSSQQMNSL